MEQVFRECIQEERARGRTVLLSSHILSEVEALCDRVSIIRRGRTVESGTLAGMRHLTRTSIVAELAGPPAGLGELPGVHDLVVQANQVHCAVDPSSLDGVLLALSRAEEEIGRFELLGATVVGRYAALTAALMVTIGATVLLGLLTAAGLVAAAEGRIRWLSWLSPLAWGHQVRPFAGNRWWVLLVLAAFALLLLAGAYALLARRDMNAGLVPERSGPADAAAGCAARSRWPGACSAVSCWPGRLRSPSAVRWWAASPPASATCWTAPRPGT